MTGLDRVVLAPLICVRKSLLLAQNVGTRAGAS